jgi:putative flavoprotein involved in K+ transport
MTARELTAHFAAYARSFAAPVQEHTTVTAVTAGLRGYRVVTDQGAIDAANVVVATGWCDRPAVPAGAALLHPSIHQSDPSRYRNPDNLPDGGVLVVGASATGVQLADELRRSGREVVLAVGAHTRLPRSYRGRDIYWWMDRLGLLTRPLDSFADPARAKQEPSLQLVGRPDGGEVDLGTLQAAGVRLAGRLTAVGGTTVSFADDLSASLGSSQDKMERTLARIDEYAVAHGLAGPTHPPVRPAPVTSRPAPDHLRLGPRSGIRTVLWATGFRRSYPWLHLPVFDRQGEIAHERGATRLPGLYVLGQRFQHRRNSHMIDGVGPDAVHLARLLTADASSRAA